MKKINAILSILPLIVLLVFSDAHSIDNCIPPATSIAVRTKPKVQITSPANGAVVNAIPITVSGTVDDPTTAVTVNGVGATVDGSGGFTAAGIPAAGVVTTLTAVAEDIDHLKSIHSIQVRLLGEVDLDVDTDRDGTVEDDEDEDGEDDWTKEKGAIYSVNFDRDGSRSAGGVPIPDAIHFDDSGNPVNEDYVIENADDEKDIAPLVIRKIQDSIPSGYKVYLKAAQLEDIQRIHVYKKIEADPANTAIWGSMTGGAPPLEIDITKWVNPSDPDFQGDASTGDTTFGIEGLCFRWQGGDAPAQLRFDGYVDLTVELRDGGTVVCSDTVRLKVAPWIMLSRDQASEEIWAEDAGADNAEFRVGLAHSGQLHTASAPDSGTQWFQDHVETGFTQRPGGPKTHVVLRAPYNNIANQPVWPLKNLLKKDVGCFQLGRSLGGDSGDYGGNLEVLPPNATHKLGRIAMGDIASPAFQQFLTSQEVQPFFDVPINWLKVGHIDEITSFLPGGEVAIADPTAAWNLMTSIPSDPLLGRGGSVFFATGAPPAAGVAIANAAANNRIETGIDHTVQPVAWKYIRIYAGAAKGTVGEIDTRGNGFITVKRVWDTTSKIIPQTPFDFDNIYHWSENELLTSPDWGANAPQQGDKYVLCEGSRFWYSNTSDPNKRTPAIVTVEEVLADTNFENLNKTAVQSVINQARAKLQAAAPGVLTFNEVPNLFFGALDAAGDLADGSAVAFNPGPTNLQPVGGSLYVPMQFGPLDAVGDDIFEKAIENALGIGFVEFVDCWDLYHRLLGEIHCGSNVKRSLLGINWWENQP